MIRALFRYFLVFSCFLLSADRSFAQVIEGTLLDIDSKETVAYAGITNKRTGISIQTNASGRYRINAYPGDTIFISHPAYSFTTKIIRFGSANDVFYVEKRRNSLGEVEILSDMAKFKRDSADRYTIYRKTLQDAHHAPSVGLSNGIAVDGLFSSLALGISGKGKKSKHFAQMLQRDEQVKFSAVRYNKKIVSIETGASDDEAEKFITAYPMPYDFVRTASDVEVKMWIRNNYKTWKTNQNKSPAK